MPADLCTQCSRNGILETFNKEIRQIVWQQQQCQVRTHFAIFYWWFSQCQASSNLSGFHRSPWSSLLFVYKLILLELPKSVWIKNHHIHSSFKCCFVHHILHFSSMIVASRVKAKHVQIPLDPIHYQWRHWHVLHPDVKHGVHLFAL